MNKQVHVSINWLGSGRNGGDVTEVYTLENETLDDKGEPSIAEVLHNLEGEIETGKTGKARWFLELEDFPDLRDGKRLPTLTKVVGDPSHPRCTACGAHDPSVQPRLVTLFGRPNSSLDLCLVCNITWKGVSQ